MRGQEIICFANDWDSDPTSKKHIMSRLSRGNRVLWVNSIGCRNPRVSARDLRRMARKACEFSRGLRRVHDDLWVLTPLAVPFHGNRAARRVNRALLPLCVRRACRRLGFRAPITWTFVPSSADIVGSLGERLVIYHCVDEFSRFSGVDAAAIDELEGRLAARADLVFVSAERLLETKRRHNPRTFLVRHGVEIEHFGRALDPATAVPADLARLPGPVVGFFGLIADWVDLELVAAVARARPDWTLALIGKAEGEVSALAGLDNVALLGWRGYDTLPAYCRGFDAAILPFRLNELTLASNPLKLREYLAAGLPVVSTAVPEAERLAPWVRVASGADGFVREIESVLGNGARGPRPAPAAAMARESWDSKLEEMTEIVGRFLGGASAAEARA